MADFAYRAYPVVFWDLFGADRPSGPHHGQRDGAAAARADDGAHRGAGGRAQHRLPRRRRAGAGAPRPEGPAGDAGLARRQRQGGRPHLRQHRAGVGRRDPARAARAREPGRRRLPRRAGARAQGPDRDRRRHGTGQRADVGPADAVAAALRDVPALAAVGALRAASRGRRPGQAGAGLLLRRGAPALHRRAEGAGRQGGAGGAADPLQGRRASTSAPRTPTTCRGDVLAQLGNRVQHALRAFTPRDAKALQAGGGDLPAQSRLRHRDGDPRGRHRRGGGLAARGQGRAGDGQPHADPPAGVAPRAGHRGRARRDDRGLAARRALRRRRSTASPPTRSWPARAEAAAQRGGDGRGDARAGGGAGARADVGAPLRADPIARARSRRSAPSSPAPSSSSSAPARARRWCAASSAACSRAAEPGFRGARRGSWR